MNSFYLTLPSDSSHSYFPENTLTQYTTHLQEKIDLDASEWEMGLVELIMPINWYNITDDQKIEITAMVPKANSQGKDIGYVKTLKLHHGYYKNMLDLMHHINGLIAAEYKVATEMLINDKKQYVFITEDQYIPKFSYMNVNRKCIIRIPKNGVISLTSKLANILGFNETIYMNMDSQELLPIKGDRPADLNANIHNIYLYSDILNFVYVGDTRAPLLRVVNVSGTHGDMLQRFYDKPIYVPLLKKHFQNIQILMRDDSGEPIPFESGKVIATVHIRKSKNSYFFD